MADKFTQYLEARKLELSHLPSPYVFHPSWNHSIKRLSTAEYRIPQEDGAIREFVRDDEDRRVFEFFPNGDGNITRCEILIERGTDEHFDYGSLRKTEEREG